MVSAAGAARKFTSSHPSARDTWRLRVSITALVGTILLALVGLLVVVPILIMIYNSFQVGQFGTTTHFGFENWTNAFSSPKVLDTLKNTVTLAAARQSIAIVIGVLTAWLLATTDLPA